jgi:hypothetical protein
MNLTSDLTVLKRTLVRRAIIFRQLVNPFSPPLDRPADRLVTYVVIEALNTWASFARAYYLSCCIGRARRENGVRVTLAGATLATSLDALFWACRIMRGAKKPPSDRRQEPAWHDPNTILRTFAVLNPSNLSEVRAAFSFSTNVFDHLPTIRNFFAHRNGETMLKVRNVARNLAINPNQRACEIVCSTMTGRPQNILTDWLDDLTVVAKLLCA